MIGKTERKASELKRIHDEVIGLKNSPLYNYRIENDYFPVVGEGNHSADIMFIGEAPGRNEAKTGRPFCGAAGRILDGLLDGAGIARETVYITNIIKDRPPKNRDPLPEEIEIYAPFLDRQIEIVEPKIIATLGRYSMSYIMERFGLSEEIRPIGHLHGKEFATGRDFGSIKIVVLYHPCVAIYNPRHKETLKKDFKLLKKLLKK